MNGLHAFYGIGTTTAPLIGCRINNAGSLNSIYWALALLILPMGLLFLFFPSPSHIQAAQQALARPAVPILIFLISAIFFAFTGAELGFAGWIYTYTTFQEYASPTMAASVNAAFWAALTIGRLIAIPLSVRLKSQIILWVDFCGVIISLLTIIFFSSSEALLWIGTIGTGLFMGPIFPTLLNDAQSRMHMSGNITSKFFAAGSLGSMVLPWLMGQLIAPYGATAAMIAVLCSILLATGTFYILNILQISAPTPTTHSSNSGRP
jgi:fucose permease